MLRVAYCGLFVVCVVVCCSLCVVRCAWFVVGCLIRVCCLLIFDGVRGVSFLVWCLMFHASRVFLFLVTWSVLRALSLVL